MQLCVCCTRFHKTARFPMLSHVLQRYLRRSLTATAGSRWYPALVGVMAIGATLSMSVPFAPILAFAVILRPEHWRRLALSAGLGCAVGGLMLYALFHHWGWEQVAAEYPELMRGRAWQDASHWLNSYGISAMLVISATPLPTTPALLYAAITDLPKTGLFLALAAGKSLKFLAYAAFVSRFPDRFRSWFIDEHIP